MTASHAKASICFEPDLGFTNQPPNISVPEWGPYSKLMAGVTHLSKEEENSIDFLIAIKARGFAPVLPLYKNPRNRDDKGGFHLSDASKGLREFAYGLDLDDSGALTARACFRSDGHHCRGRFTFTNKTLQTQWARLEILAVRPPEFSPTPGVRLQPGTVWVDGSEYTGIQAKHPQGTDGFPALVEPDRDACNGRVLGGSWSIHPGTRADYRVRLPEPSRRARLGIRYRRPSPNGLRFFLSWNGQRLDLDLPVTANYDWFWLELPVEDANNVNFSVGVDGDPDALLTKTINGDPAPTGFRIDGFALDGKARKTLAEIVSQRETDAPCAPSPRHDGFSFPFAGRHYRITCPTGNLVLTRTGAGLFGDQVARSLPPGTLRLHQWSAPEVEIPEQSSTTVEIAFATGPDASSLAEPPAAGAKPSAREKPAAPLSEAYPEGSRQMTASCLMNVSYPVFLGSRAVAAHTPGKRWGGLYSWDAGMHGIGLLEADPQAALECLNLYLCGPDDEQDFVWHGSPVPTQAYLWQEIFQRTRSRKLAEWFYPRLCRFYRYLAGKVRGSPTDRFGNGLLNTFPIFYNTGGWDDLPPQVAVHRDGLTEQVTPVSTTAHAIRFARILQQTAAFLGLDSDCEEFDADIERGIAAVERTWDEKESTYSYVWHDDFRPFLEPGGRNFNHTLDGMIPLVSGGIQRSRRTTLWARLRDPGRYATPAGLSTVDLSAPYYNPDGYWNGCVWIPHQWLLWKAALDDGQKELAVEIPQRAAAVWEREALTRKQSGEYFRISTEKIGGYPHFAGLSAPILHMMTAISQPGRVSGGFDAEIRNVQASGDRVEFEVRCPTSDGRPLALVVMPRAGRCTVTGTGDDVQAETDAHGCLPVDLPADGQWRPLSIRSRGPGPK